MAPSAPPTDSPTPAPAPPTTATPTARPLSESLLNEKWDRALSSALIKSSLGAGFGIVFSVLLFKRRGWPVWTGLGFGAGRAWEEADGESQSYAVLKRMRRMVCDVRNVKMRKTLEHTVQKRDIGQWLRVRLKALLTCTRLVASFRKGGAPNGRDGLRIVRS